MNLFEALSQIEDFRQASGRRHPLPVVLLLVIMALMSGHTGYRAIGDFIDRHRAALLDQLHLTKDRLPSFSTVRRVLMGLDFAQLSEVFITWMRAQTPQEGSFDEAGEGSFDKAAFQERTIPCEAVSLDGKSIKATLRDYRKARQNFTALVSAFAHSQGLVLGSAAYQNKAHSEILLVQELIEALHLQGVVFTLDALHCQKKL